MYTFIGSDITHRRVVVKSISYKTLVFILKFIFYTSNKTRNDDAERYELFPGEATYFT